MSSSSSQNIKSWLNKSREVRQQRISQLTQFDSFIESKSEAPSHNESSFLKKYEIAQSKLKTLQQQLSESKIISPFKCSELSIPCSDTESDSDSMRITISSPQKSSSQFGKNEHFSDNFLKPPLSNLVKTKTKRKSPRKLSFDFSPPLSSKSEFGSPKSVNSTIYEICDESERILADKEADIGIYRKSVLTQIEKAQNQRESILEQRNFDTLAMHFYTSKMMKKYLKKWRKYTINEREMWHEYNAKCTKLKCWNEWKRMYQIIQTIQTKKYLNIWRQSNRKSLDSVHKLLAFPTKSRWHFLKIISILRLYKNSFGHRQCKVIFDRLFRRNRSVILFVLLSSWRSLAQQKNIAAFNILTLLRKSDKMKMIKTLRKWRFVTKLHKKKRTKVLRDLTKMNEENIKKRHFKQWINVFVYCANNKISLFFWCHSMQNKALNHWKECYVWSVCATKKAEKFYKMKMFKRYFEFLVDEYLRIQNEKQWQKFRDASKAKEKEIEVVEQKESLIAEVKSIQLDHSQNLFFPLCGKGSKVLNNDRNKVQMSYVKHCELQKLLIPKYDSKMAEKYK